jgi:hypothetical protein
MFGKDAGRLAHNDQAALGDFGREAQNDVDESRHVKFFGVGCDVESGVDPGVSFDEGLYRYFAAAAEQGVVGAGIEGDFFVAASGNGSIHSRFLSSLNVEVQKDYSWQVSKRARKQEDVALSVDEQENN